MIAYFNCFSGISGDMLLGALVDAGVSLEELRKKLSLLSVRGYELKARKVKRAGISATKVDVEIQGAKGKGQRAKGKKAGRRKADAGAYGHTPTVRKWKDIEKIIKTSKLSDGIKQKGLHVFKRLFEAEAKVHGEKMKAVHLHELGATDCIVDIMGTLIGLDMLGVESVYSSPLNLGSGTVNTEHGILPVPAPATAELLKGKPVYSSGVPFELTTPTGAVLVSSLAKGFGSMPEMEISSIGTGAGYKDFKEQPNVLTMVAGQRTEDRTQNTEHRLQNIDNRAQTTDNEVTIIETNIDDMNPQVYEYVMEKLFKAGALDVFLTQIIMKKGRPAVKLSALCNGNDREKLIGIIMSETTSIGVRFYRAGRKILDREIKPVKTEFGSVNLKVSRIGNKREKSSVEYEDCKKIAKKFNVPLLEVMKAIKL